MRRGDAGGQEGLGRLRRLDGEQGFHDPVGGRDAVWFREVPVGGAKGRAGGCGTRERHYGRVVIEGAVRTAGACSGH
jgi:hypothetical protein